LNEEIKDHTVLTYKQIRGDQAEVDVHENGKIWDMYSAYEFNLSDYCHDIDVIAGECYNREHILPKSWWGYSEANEANDPMYTDLHHVISTDAVANDTRSNYIYDEVKNATWTNNLGSKLGTSMNWYNQTAFEPVDEYKGDIARVYFYMLTCYMDQNFAVNAKGKKYFSYTNGVCEFQPQALALMLKWHRQDPVSEKEVVRNAKVADLQGNVNPFVVEPNLVDYIWGTMKGKAYDCDAEVETPDPGTVDGAITCQEARELALALADNTQSVEDYVVVGYVSALDVDYSTQYGNQSFWVADELNGGQVFYAYRCYNESPVNLGDKVSLTGKLLNYYGTPEMKLGQTNVLESASTSGVEDVEVLDWRDADVEIYSVTGQKMSGMREELPQGVYVLRRGDRVSRVVVR
jgi:endonuclease I